MVTPDVIWHDDARRRRLASGRPKLLRAGALLNHRIEAQGATPDDARRRRPAAGRPKLLRAGALLPE